MKSYTVKIKEVYTYEEVKAKNKQEAIQKVLNMDWREHDECDRPLETKAIEERREE